MPFGGGTGKQASSTKPPETMFLSAVRVDSQACADRIIFDFKPANGASPGYAVEYRPADEAQTEDASGNQLCNSLCERRCQSSNSSFPGAGKTDFAPSRFLMVSRRKWF